MRPRQRSSRRPEFNRKNAKSEALKARVAAALDAGARTERQLIAVVWPTASAREYSRCRDILSKTRVALGR